jgi:GntR family colanic acid and biofilm gene transcriptional regulator
LSRSGAAVKQMIARIGRTDVMQPLEQQNLSARAYASLREALIAGHFGPGQRLVLHELAQTLGTSVTPVREACLTLVSERALEMRLGRSVTVPELSLSRYIEIRTIRIALEGLAAELAVNNAQKSDIANLVRIQKEFKAANSKRDSEVATRLNREFHFGVYRLCGMEMLISQIEGLWICMGPILKLYHEQMADAYRDADEHVHIIDALRDRDGAAARKALERDLLRGGEGIVKYLEQMRSAENGKRVG